MSTPGTWPRRSSAPMSTRSPERLVDAIPNMSVAAWLASLCRSAACRASFSGVLAKAHLAVAAVENTAVFSLH
jgi:hypothetical protein